jgi:DNA-binding NtrC family response regulator
MSTILIIDEDQTIRLLYAVELADEGYDVITCGNASSVMQLIRQKRPDLIVMEILLGKLNGLDILQDIRATYPDLPVILCTVSPNFKHDRRSAPAHGYVIKSSKVKELKAVIEDVLERDHQLAPLHAPCTVIPTSRWPS